MDATETRATLAFAEAARQRAREDIARPWVPLVLLGSLSVAGLSLTGSPSGLSALFWAFAGPLGAGALAVYAYRRTRSSGIEASPFAYVAITVGLLILAYAVGKVAFAFQIPELGRAGPPLVVAIGYLALAWVERSRIVAFVAVALIAATAATVGFGLDSQQSNALMFVIYGLTLVAVGFGIRTQRLHLT